MHRLDLGFDSHPEEFFYGMESEPMLAPREKSPQPESPRSCITRDSGPNTLPTEPFWPSSDSKSWYSGGYHSRPDTLLDSASVNTGLHGSSTM